MISIPRAEAAHKAAKEEREQREQRAAAAQREQESVQRDAVKPGECHQGG